MYEADHLADSLARRAVAVRFVFSQLPLSRFEGSFSVAFTVVCAPLAAFMRTGKVVVFRRGLWRDRRVSALEERVQDSLPPGAQFVGLFASKPP